MSTVLTDENFDKEIQRTDKMALVDFYATWCEPCKRLAPILEKMEKEFQGKIALLKANVDEMPLSSQKFQVNLFPTVILFKNGRPINSFVGFKTEPELKQWLMRIIQDNK